jgi:hypothetical protein
MNYANYTPFIKLPKYRKLPKNLKVLSKTSKNHEKVNTTLS